MGTATLAPAGPFEAGSMQCLTLTYTAGAFGIDDTGSLKIGLRFATDFGPVQCADPGGPGYTTAEASNGATLELKWEFKRNIRPWSRSLYIGVVKDFLAPGDTITIRFGDRRRGSPGIRMQTYCEEAFEFHVLADPIATYDYVPLPASPRIAIIPGPGVAWRAVAPTLVAAGQPFWLGLKADDRWGNPGVLAQQTLRLVASRPITGLPATVAIAAGEVARRLDGLVAAEPGDLTIAVLDAAGRALCLANPIRIAPATTPLRHYWGDTHGQSDETLGTNPARAYFEFGRDKAFLDVIGHQGNDFQITAAFWAKLNQLTAELDQPGAFVCIPGYEWSANTAVGGDRNVHFRHDGETIHRSSHAQIADRADLADEATDAHTAHDLFARLAGRDCVIVAHVGGRYADIAWAHDGRLETAVEVHSAWGTFEWLLEDALRLGHRVGIVANSDGHKGRPGACYPGASFFGSYGGLTCFLSAGLDRDGIFESMRRRHHYATTGNRAFLDVAVTTTSDVELFLRDPALGATKTLRTRRAIIGDIARLGDDEVTLAIEVVGSAPIERIDIYDGLDRLETLRPYGEADLGRRVRMIYTGAEVRGRARTTTWDGTLRLDGAAITGAEMFNNWNLDRGIEARDGHNLAFKAVTTGTYGGIDLWLDRGDGRATFATAPASGAVDLATLGVEPVVHAAGGLGRAIEWQRLPDALDRRHLRLERRIKVRAGADTRLYVRVQQIDGHRLWSSPIYLFR